MKTRRRKQAPPIWTPHEWVPFNDAFVPIMATAGSPALAADDLYRDLRSERLSSALRQKLPNSKYNVRFLSPPDWQQWTVRWEHGYTPTGAGTIALVVLDKDNKAVDGHFFVRRADLDKHYGTPTATAAGDAQPTLSQQRKRGPKADWRLTYAGEAYLFKKKTGRLPSAVELAKICADKLEHQPEPRSIQALLNYLVGE